MIDRVAKFFAIFSIFEFGSVIFLRIRMTRIQGSKKSRILADPKHCFKLCHSKFYRGSCLWAPLTKATPLGIRWPRTGRCLLGPWRSNWRRPSTVWLTTLTPTSDRQVDGVCREKSLGLDNSSLNRMPGVQTPISNRTEISFLIFTEQFFSISLVHLAFHVISRVKKLRDSAGTLICGRYFCKNVGEKR